MVAETLYRERRCVVTGIIDFHGMLIRADEVIMAHQHHDDVIVTIRDWDNEVTMHNCSLADFRDAWRKALRD